LIAYGTSFFDFIFLGYIQLRRMVPLNQQAGITLRPALNKSSKQASVFGIIADRASKHKPMQNGVVAGYGHQDSQFRRIKQYPPVTGPHFPSQSEFI